MQKNPPTHAIWGVDTAENEPSEVWRPVDERLEALIDNLEPYWEFVRCAKALLHPPRRWDLPGVEGKDKIEKMKRITSHFWEARSRLYRQVR